jgi:reticulon-4-interacting protein 1, mitochondrial
MTSQAWTFTNRGKPAEVLTLTERPNPTAEPSLPLPKDVPQPEEWISVKVAYAALSPGGLFHIGLMPAFARAKVAVPEMDLSGTVVDVWTPSATSGLAASAKFAKGDKIMAFLPIKHTFPTGNGALSTHVSFPARYAVPKPETLAFGPAAGVLLAGCTAWMQVQESKVKVGDRVLVNGGAGGVGTFVVQMARNVVGKAGFVAAVCSGRNEALMKELGADEVSI